MEMRNFFWRWFFMVAFLFEFSNSLIAPIPAKCSNTSALNLWEQYDCAVRRKRLDVRCVPTYLKAGSGLNDLTAKGLVVMFHGYTACPAAYDVYAQNFKSAGFHVLNVLDEGHGREYNDCNMTGSGCVNGDPVGGLPMHRGPYLQSVDTINAMVREQLVLISKNPSFVTTVVGHSLGGGLATIAVIRGNSGSAKLYDKVLLLSPFFGITVPSLDRAVESCGTTSECISKLVSNVVSGAQASQVGLAAKSNITQAMTQLLTQELTANARPDAVANRYHQLMAALRFVFQLLAESSNLPPSIEALLQSSFGWGPQCERSMPTAPADVLTCAVVLLSL
jgi:pimeloyl-ACP methyl ester carboxylesterase